MTPAASVPAPSARARPAIKEQRCPLSDHLAIRAEKRPKRAIRCRDATAGPQSNATNWHERPAPRARRSNLYHRVISDNRRRLTAGDLISGLPTRPRCRIQKLRPARIRPSRPTGVPRPGPQQSPPSVATGPTRPIRSRRQAERSPDGRQPRPAAVSGHFAKPMRRRPVLHRQARSTATSRAADRDGRRGPAGHRTFSYGWHAYRKIFARRRKRRI